MSTSIDPQKAKDAFFEAFSAISVPTALTLEDTVTDKEGVNPGLLIEGIGKLNVPIPESTKLGEQSAQGVEQVEASKIQLRNPGFQKWLDEIVRKISDTVSLGSKDKVKAQLLKLVACNRTSVASNITEGISIDDGTLGFVAVALQSDFEGGELKLRYDAKEELFPVSGDEEFQTSAISWYGGVEATVGSITKGRRVFLLYSLSCTDATISKLPSPNAKLEAAMRQFQDAGISVCRRLGGWYNKVSGTYLQGKDRFQIRQLIDSAKSVWGPSMELYIARALVSEEDINLNDFDVLRSELGKMPGNLGWDKNDIRERNLVDFDQRVYLVIWPLSKHVEFAKKFRSRPDKYNTYMGSQKLAGLYEAKPITDQGRAMWLKCLIELQVSQTYKWDTEQWGWKNFWELTEKAIIEWPEVADRAIPEAVKSVCGSIEERDGITFYRNDLFKEKHFAKYVDLWDQYCFERALQGLDNQVAFPMIMAARYGISTLDWTRVFMTAINLMPYIEWYRAVEENLAFFGTTFKPDISRPLALPLLIQNFRVDPRADMKNDRRTGKMHSYHRTDARHIKLLLELIMEAKYNNRDFYLGIVLPQLKCPDRVGNDDRFWKPLGEIYQKDFASSESKLMKDFVAQYKIDLEKALKA